MALRVFLVRGEPRSLFRFPCPPIRDRTGHDVAMMEEGSGCPPSYWTCGVMTVLGARPVRNLPQRRSPESYGGCVASLLIVIIHFLTNTQNYTYTHVSSRSSHLRETFRKLRPMRKCDEERNKSDPESKQQWAWIYGIGMDVP